MRNACLRDEAQHHGDAEQSQLRARELVMTKGDVHLMPIDENARFAGGSKRPRIQTGASRVWPGGHHLVQVWALPSCVTRHTEARSSVIVLRVAAEHGMNCTWSSLPIGGGGGFSSSFPSSTFPAAVASSGMPACFGAAASNDLDALLYACNHFWMCVNLCLCSKNEKKITSTNTRGTWRVQDGGPH